MVRKGKKVVMGSKESEECGGEVQLRQRKGDRRIFDDDDDEIGDEFRRKVPSWTDFDIDTLPRSPITISDVRESDVDKAAATAAKDRADRKDKGGEGVENRAEQREKQKHRPTDKIAASADITSTPQNVVILEDSVLDQETDVDISSANLTLSVHEHDIEEVSCIDADASSKSGDMELSDSGVRALQPTGATPGQKGRRKRVSRHDTSSMNRHGGLCNFALLRYALSSSSLSSSSSASAAAAASASSSSSSLSSSLS
jgi:hypothetical protein